MTFLYNFLIPFILNAFNSIISNEVKTLTDDRHLHSETSGSNNVINKTNLNTKSYKKSSERINSDASLVYDKENTNSIIEQITTKYDVYSSEDILTKENMKDVLLRQGKNVEFDNQVFLITFKNGTKAVFKPCSPYYMRTALAEVAAYKFSLYFAPFIYVPSTKVCTIDGQLGSLQEYIETDIDLVLPSWKDAIKGKKHTEFDAVSKELDKKRKDLETLIISAGKEKLGAYAALMYVIGQWDIGPHNMLLKKIGKGELEIVCIDNAAISTPFESITCTSYPFVNVYSSSNFNTSDHDKPFPFKSSKRIHKPTVAKLKSVFGNKIDDSFYKGMEFYGWFEYVIWRSALWKKVENDTTLFIRSHLKYCPQQVLQRLKELNLKTLKEIFYDAKDDFANEPFLHKILERRDKILKEFKYS